MKGLFYGGPGNLSDGSSLVAGQWGPKFEDGDVIGMRLEQKNNTVTLAFSKNSEWLGVAFSISGWKDGELCPAISMDKSGQGAFISETTLPNFEDLGRSSTFGDGVEGSWKGRFKLEIEKGQDHEWNISAKIANIISCSVTETNGKFTAGNIMSTLMLAPPELRPLEEELRAVLTDITGLRREGESLILEGAGKQEIFKLASGFESASQENIKWMN